MRLLVIMPRSPTSTTSVRPKRSRTVARAALKAAASEKLPGKTSTATGRPAALVMRPSLIAEPA